MKKMLFMIVFSGHAPDITITPSSQTKRYRFRFESDVISPQICWNIHNWRGRLIRVDFHPVIKRIEVKIRMFSRSLPQRKH